MCTEKTTVVVLKITKTFLSTISNNHKDVKLLYKILKDILLGLECGCDRKFRLSNLEISFDDQ